MKNSIRSLAIALIVSLSPGAWATAVYVLTTSNQLMVVNAAVPQEILSIKPITGLAANESLLGIDVRPATGVLYGLSGPTNARLFTIDPNTGVATLVAALAANPTDTTDPFTGLTGTRIAIDFNPVADRLRIVSDAEQNLRVDPANGLVTTDGPLAYATGDVRAGVDPTIGAIAYTPIVNIGGLDTTTLFGIDDKNFQIVLQNPPNNGTLNSHSAFGVENATHVGFDFASNGIAYTAGKHEVPGSPIEYILATVDPDQGNLTGESHGVIGDGTIPVRDIAVAPSVAFSASRYAISEDGGSATITVKRENFLNTTVSVQYSTFTNTASAGNDYTTAAGTLTFAATEDTKTFQVPIINDAFPEDDELIGLLLSGVSGPAIIGPPGIALLRINPNDRPDFTGPQVLFVGLTGPSRGINGAVVHFNEDMDLATVQNADNYRLIAFQSNGQTEVKQVTTAVYDPVGRRVTLSIDAFMQTEFKKMVLQINGKKLNSKRPQGVSDLAGNLLDGDRNGIAGGDAVQAFKVFSGKEVKFVDRDGDRVTIGIENGGQLDGVVPVGGAPTQTTQFWILDPIALRSTLSGTVQRSPRGDGIVVIAEIIGLDKKEFAPIISNTGFRINTLTFSSNATGIGLR